MKRALMAFWLFPSLSSLMRLSKNVCAIQMMTAQYDGILIRSHWVARPAALCHPRLTVPCSAAPLSSPPRSPAGSSAPQIHRMNPTPVPAQATRAVWNSRRWDRTATAPGHTSNCKINGHFSIQIIIFQVQFSIISAFSIENSGNKVGIYIAIRSTVQRVPSLPPSLF